MTAIHSEEDYGRLIVQGADQPGIVARVSTVLAEHGANVVALDQSTSDPTGGRFFQRTVFTLPNLSTKLPELERSLDEKLVAGFGLSYRLVEARRRKRVAIMVSKAEHCLLDLLWRQRRGDLDMTVAMVISNHPDLGDDVRQFGIPFFHVPVEKNRKDVAEKEHLNLLKGNVDTVVLARYMQIISGDFLDELAVPVINIHHSFLPAFMGAGPYQRAKERGVKLVGATAHYVTEDLDEGPIIEQDVIRVSHEDTTRDLQRKGADVERLVLSRAVAWHCDDRVIRDGTTTVVF
jgi:formyltetrahydrofolate deformylase